MREVGGVCMHGDERREWMRMCGKGWERRKKRDWRMGSGND